MSDSESVVLEYPKAGFSKRVFAFLFDFLCAVFLATGVAALGSLGLEQAAFYQSAVATMNQVELDSGLYVRQGTTLSAITDVYVVSSSSPTETDYQTLDDEFEASLVSFYDSAVFFPNNEGQLIYQKLKIGDSSLTYEANGVTTSYWKTTLDAEGKSVIVKNCDYETLYDFYQTAIDDYAIPAISSSSLDYIAASRTVFWGTVLVVVISAWASLAVFFFLIPLFFRRGRQTFGMKLFHLSLISAKAVSPSGKQYAFRSLLFFFAEFVLGTFSFGIPVLISFTMAAVRKDGQSFHDYVAGTYVVDSSERPVYLSYADYETKSNKSVSFEISESDEVAENKK